MEVNHALGADLIVRFFINAIALFVLLRLIHFRASTRRASLGGLLLVSNGVFIVTALLYDVEMSMGFAFGLFALFAMLRYRTESLSTVEMGYLFISIAISLLSAVGGLTVTELLLVNGAICVLAVVCESRIVNSDESEKSVTYERIELIHPARRDELHADLEQRLGVAILRIDVGDVDFLRDTAQLRLTVREPGRPALSAPVDYAPAPRPVNRG